MTNRYNATVVGIERLSADLMILRVKPDAAAPSFTPGQFAILGLRADAIRFDGTQDEAMAKPDTLIRKAYSIASSPADVNTLEFYVALVPGGSLTPRLFALKLGERLFVGPRITGKFTLDKVPAGKHVLMVSTGTGLAPYMSMIRAQLVCGGERRFVVLHGARHSDELGYYAELSLLSRNCPNLIYLPAVSRPKEDANWAGLTGRVTTLLKAGVIEQKTGLSLDPTHFDVFLCGNPDMIHDVASDLQTKGFVLDTPALPGNIHQEEYW